MLFLLITVASFSQSLVTSDMASGSAYLFSDVRLLHNRHLYVGSDFHEVLCFTQEDVLQYQNPGYASHHVVTDLSPDAGFPDAVRLCPNPAGG